MFVVQVAKRLRRVKVARSDLPSPHERQFSAARLWQELVVVAKIASEFAEGDPLILFTNALRSPAFHVRTLAAMEEAPFIGMEALRRPAQICHALNDPSARGHGVKRLRAASRFACVRSW